MIIGVWFLYLLLGIPLAPDATLEMARGAQIQRVDGRHHLMPVHRARPGPSGPTAIQ